MKIQFSLPKNQDFFNRYATLIPTLSKLGFLAQIVSSLTEIGVIYGLIYSRLLEYSPTFAIVTALFGAIIGTAFLEIGLRKFTPYSIRIFLDKRFKGLDLAMTFFILFINVGLLFASATLSFQGSKELIEVVQPEVQKENTFKIDSDYQKRKKEFIKSFISDSTTIATNYQNQITAKDNYYTSLVAAKESKIKNYQRKEQRTSKSYQTKKENLRGSIQKLKAEKSNTISLLELKKANELKQLISERKENLKKIEDRFYQKEKTIIVENQKMETKANAKTGKYGNMLAYFTIICLFVFVLSVALDEINKKGSGINQIAIPNQYNFSQSIFSDFTNMLSDKYNYHLREKIRKYADTTPQAPLPSNPPLLFNLGTIEQPRLNLEMEKTETKTIYLKSNFSEFEQPIQIEEIENEILNYVKASNELKKSNLIEQAKEMELKADQVIRTYLKSKGKNTDMEVTNLRNGIINFLKGKGLNPFEKQHRRNIGFKVNEPLQNKPIRKSYNDNSLSENQRICNHCNTPYNYRHHKQKYCCDECRIKAWESRTGKSLKLKKKK